MKQKSCCKYVNTIYNKGIIIDKELMFIFFIVAHVYSIITAKMQVQNERKLINLKKNEMRINLIIPISFLESIITSTHYYPF